MSRWLIVTAFLAAGLILWGCSERKKPDKITLKDKNVKEGKPNGSKSKADSTDMAKVAKGKKLLAVKACSACHSDDGTPRVGPTFKNLYGTKKEVVIDGEERTITADEDYIVQSIKKPNAAVVKGYQKGQMVVSTTLNDSEIDAIVSYIKSIGQVGFEGKEAKEAHERMAKKTQPKGLGEAEMKAASEIYFNRCAGCHGMLRKGATGPSLMPNRVSKKLGTEGIKAVVNYGLPGGMPAWGKLGILNDDEVELMAKFLQQTPPDPPEMSLDDMEKTWKVHVPVGERPKKPQHKYDWENFFGVILRDAGKVAIIDGDSKKLVNIINTGFAVHILRSSATGRYFYSIGRDGRVTMIDLWMKKPDKVAEVKVCYDARSVDSSKYKGPKGDYLDKYLLVGGYWPPSLIVLNGQTLKPLKLVSTSSYTYDTYEFLREARVAAIVASHHDPLWVANIKETGYVWLVDYQDIDNLKITTIEAERFLHDGGWDKTKRYVLMAANARNKIAVVDTYDKKLEALVKVGKTPHPGRGANFTHPKYGPVWATGHLGDNTIAFIGTDPKGHPKHAWKMVQSIELPGGGGGNLFIKTHPNSKWIWADRPLHPDPKTCRTIYVISKETLEVEKTITLPEKYPGRAVHIEYNKAGTEAWISAWSPKTKPSAIFIFDDKTLKEKKVITGDWLITPTGKFNVKNTTHDIY